MISPIIFNSSQLSILNVLYANFIASGGYVPKANPNNNTSVDSVYSATLQGLSGEVDFANITLGVGTAVEFVINNSYSASGKRVYAYISSPNNGRPYVLYSLCNTGNITIVLSSLVDPEDAVGIGFIFLN